MTDPFLDISGEICPMTLVHARLFADGLAPGTRARIRLARGEPSANVPRALAGFGHRVEGLADDSEGDPGVVVLTITAGGGRRKNKPAK